MVKLPQKWRAPTIRQWEEAGTALASSLSKYLDLCISLGPDSQKDGTPQNALAIRIDSALETLHAQLEHQLDQSRSILARTRNQLQSPISHFPSEILSEIFTYIVFDPIDPSEPVPMENSLANIYQSVHNLLGVCSTWKNVVLAWGLLWSIVPIIGPKRSIGISSSTRLSLERSGNTDLHLAAITPEDEIDEDFTKHASRFTSINIVSESIFTIGKLLSHFIQFNSQSRLSNLLLSLKTALHSGQIQPECTCLSQLPPFGQTDFEGLLQSLSVLRLSDLVFDWDKVQFSHRLVELDLQNLTLGSDLKLLQLLTSISSATELRTLKFASVITYTHFTLSANAVTVSLPKLQTMVVRDLFYNTLCTILSSIKSRSHCLTLHLTKRTFKLPISDNTGPEDAFVLPEDVTELFCQVTVNTLLLEAFEDEGPWLSGMDIRSILHSMPEIETLRIHDWDFPTNLCKMMQHPRTFGQPKFLRPKNFHLTRARIRDEEAFKEMVASYFESLEYMELAGAVVKGSKCAMLNDYLQGEEPIVAWFEENVPNFELTSNYETPPEFCAPV